MSRDQTRVGFPFDAHRLNHTKLGKMSEEDMSREDISRCKEENPQSLESNGEPGDMIGTIARGNTTAYSQVLVHI